MTLFYGQGSPASRVRAAAKKKNSLHLTTKSLRVLILSTPPSNTGKPGNFHQVCKRGELEQFLF